MASKKPNPFLEKREEKTGKDLDRDGEKGESAAHKAKVLGTPAKKGSAQAGKMCAACTKAKKSSCSHR